MQRASGPSRGPSTRLLLVTVLCRTRLGRLFGYQIRAHANLAAIAADAAAQIASLFPPRYRRLAGLNAVIVLMAGGDDTDQWWFIT